VEANKTTAKQAWGSARPSNIQLFVIIHVRETLTHHREEIQIDRVLGRYTILAGQTDRQRGKRAKTFKNIDSGRRIKIRIQQTVRHWKIKIFPICQQTKNSKRRHIQINLGWTEGLTDVMILLGENEL
jgi:hypothetical protein